MSNNITWADKTNDPSKPLTGATTQFPAADINALKAHANSPSQTTPITLTPSAVVVDGTKKISDYTTTGNLTLVWSGTPKENNTLYGKITFNGSHTFDLPTNTVFTYVGDNSYNIGDAPVSGTYDLLISYFNDEYQVILKERDLVTNDVTAPTFSNVSVDNLGETTADFNAEIDEAGTIFWAAYPTATGQQTKAAIEAGTGATDYGSIATSGSTIETDGITGLTASTAYKVHYFARDSSSNESAATLTSEFTTNSVYAFANIQELVVDASGEGVTVINDNSYPSDGAETDNPWSVFFRYKSPVLSAGEQLLVCRDTVATAPALITVGVITGNRLTAVFLTDASNKISRSGNIVTGTAILSDNTVYTICVTYDGSETAAGIKIYVDGTEETVYVDASAGSYTGIPAQSGSFEMDFGNSQGGSPGYGSYRVAQVFDKELSSAEVSTLNGSNNLQTAGLIDDCTQENLFEGDANADNIGNNGTTEGTATYNTF